MGEGFALGMLVAVGAAVWVLFDHHKRSRRWFDAIAWAVGVWALLIVFLPIYLIRVRPRLGVSRPVAVHESDPFSDADDEAPATPEGMTGA